MTALVWYLDRASALVAFPALYLAVLTGIPFNTPAFGFVHRAARRVHVEVAAFAVLITLLHAVLGVLDAWYVVSGQAPAPDYSTAYLLGGVGVGMGALVLVIVAVLGFVDGRRFERPWGPRVVHAFAYAGFVFAVVHAAAIGTDVVGLLRSAIVPSVAFVGYLLGLRLLVESGWLSIGRSSPGAQ